MDFLILDLDGRPLGGAEVAVFDAPGPPSSIVPSDTTGKCRALVPAASDIIVSCPGYSRFMAPAGSIELVRGVAEVRLRPGGLVRGAVVMAENVLSKEGVRVVLWPSEAGEFTVNHARSARTGDRRVFSTATDSSGQFEFSELPPKGRFTVFAAGPGTIQTGGPLLVESGDMEVRIPLAPVFVLDLQLVDRSTGEPIQGPGCLEYGSAGRSSLRDLGDGAALFPANCPLLEWSGVAPHSEEAFKNAGRVFMAFAIDADRDKHGPFQIHATAPGYEAQDIEVWALRPGAEVRVTQEVELQRRCTGFGSLSVRLSDSSRALADRMKALNAAWADHGLSLTMWQGDGEPAFIFDVSTVGKAPLEIKGIPAGSYLAMAHVPLGPPELAARVYRVDVQIGSTSVVELDLSSCSVVVICPSEEQGREYQGSLQLVVRRVPGKKGGAWQFKGPPYSMIGMGPGTFEVRAVGTCQSEWARFSVDLSGQARVQLPVTSPRKR